MSSLVFGQDFQVGKWVAERVPQIGHHSQFGSFKAIGIIDDLGTAIFGVVYHNFHPRYRSMHATIASESPRWATRGNLAAIFRYPFVQAECNRVATFIPAKNERSVRLCEGLGFSYEGRGREGFLDDDILGFGMLKRDCKWIKEK